jgi:hypothetical protein
MNSRPLPSEYATHCAKYIALVPAGDLVAILESESRAMLALLHSISEEKSAHRYAPGKWSVRETVLHVADVERVLSYRALRFARSDSTPLAGFEPSNYIAPSDAENRTWRSIIQEFAAVREATLALFRSLPPDAWLRGGIADGSPYTVRAIACTLVGHGIHHRKILSERYLAD